MSMKTADAHRTSGCRSRRKESLIEARAHANQKRTNAHESPKGTMRIGRKNVVLNDGTSRLKSE